MSGPHRHLDRGAVNRRLGRLVGLAVGLIGGVPGVVVGLLIGTLVDQIRSQAPATAHFDRFLRRGGRRRDAALAPWYLTALAIARVASADGPPRRSQIDAALSGRWPEPDGATPLPPRHVLVDRAIVAVRASADARFDAEAGVTFRGARAAELMRLLVAVAAADQSGISAAERAVLDAIAGRIDVAPPLVRAWEREVALLDAQACAVLGVSRSASADEVRQAWRALAAASHPDAPEGSAEAFRTAQAAYTRLTEQLHESE